MEPETRRAALVLEVLRRVAPLVLAALGVHITIDAIVHDEHMLWLAVGVVAQIVGVVAVVRPGTAAVTTARRVATMLLVGAFAVVAWDRLEIVTPWLGVLMVLGGLVSGLRSSIVAIAVLAVFDTWFVAVAYGWTSVLDRVLPVVGFAVIGGIVHDTVAEAMRRTRASTLRQIEVQTTLDHAPIGIVHVRPDGNVSLVNRVVADFLGLADPPTDVSDLLDHIHPDDVGAIHRLVDEVLAGRPSSTVARGRHHVAGYRQVRVLAAPVHDADGQFVGGSLTLQDIHDDLLRARELEQFRSIAEATSDLIGVASVRGDTDYLNPAGQRFFGVTSIGLPDVWRHVATRHRRLLTDVVQPTIDAVGLWNGELDILDANGTPRPSSTVIIGLRDDEGAIVSYVVSYRDLAERKQLEARLAHQAGHDPLTGLPNRQQLFEILGDALDVGERVSVLFGDLDGFKLINDSIGHAAGDAVLTEVARRLGESARGGDMVARLGGDEFVVVCRGPISTKEAIAVADRFVESVSEPILHGGREHVVSMSIGIAQRGDDDHVTASDLVQRADLAMYAAKLRGRGRVTVYDQVMRTRASTRIELEADLRDALATGQIELRFQPVVNTRTGDVVGFEALSRWHHPTRGLVFPKEFISAIDAAGLATEFAEHSIREAVHSVMMMRLVAPWVTVSVNLSAAQMLEPDLVEIVAAELQHARVPAEALTFEITEDIVMDELAQARPRLEQLRSLGVRFAIDDFGTGYSNLALLQGFSADFVKVDRSLVHGNRELLRLVLSLTGEMGFVAIGEGVETRRQADELAEFGCHLGQGYFFSPPLTTAEAIAYLDTTGQRVDA
jgi:diguanylate cyclase (GGDEF)-like protein/PAS domain S-box-containing protein